MARNRLYTLNDMRVALAKIKKNIEKQVQARQMNPSPNKIVI